jgi:hypothetical protein
MRLVLPTLLALSLLLRMRQVHMIRGEWVPPPLMWRVPAGTRPSQSRVCIMSIDSCSSPSTEVCQAVATPLLLQKLRGRHTA